MKALVTSDTHRRDAGLYDLQDRYQDQVDLWLHAGDSELDPHDPALTGFQVVSGNTDWGTNFPEQLEFKLGPYTGVIVHGDRYRVNQDFSGLYELAVQKDVQIVLYGHTHIARADEIDGKVFVNPGSLHFSRGGYPDGSYALLTATDGQLTVTYYTEAHQVIETLSRTFQIKS